jgi:hypothetical protein
VAGTSSVVKLPTDTKETECAKVGTQSGTTFTTLNIQININEMSIIQIIIHFHIWTANIPEISVVNLLSDNWQHIFCSYLKFNPLTLDLNDCSYLQKTNLNGGCIRTDIYLYDFLCFVDCAYLYNFVNETNLVHNLFLVYLSVSTCFGQLFAHRQEIQLCFVTIGTCYSVWMCLVCRVEFIPPCIPDSSTQNNKYQLSQNTVVSPDDGHTVAQNM